MRARNANPEHQHASDVAEYFARHVPYRPRGVHQAFARFNGYFWLPCPLCGEEFGGHEWRDIDGKPSSIPDGENPRMGHGICPICTAKGLGGR